MSETATATPTKNLDLSGYTPPDTRFGPPFIDLDEWRDTPRRHRYVHGGFAETHTLFSFYFPEADEYRGRFFQYLEGGAGGHENLIAASAYGPAMSFDWQFGLCHGELGGYIVESNQGHFPGEGTGFADDIQLWAASAETALFGKHLARLIYGREPHHGYVWGVSGGGGRSCHCLEQRPDVWQGGAPHAGVGQTTQWSPWALTWLLARKQFPQIIDAAEPGGSGDPFDGLSHTQRAALAELYRRGYPRGAESQLGPFMAWAFTMQTLLEEDPSYFDDFWNKPGYLGHDDARSLDAVRVSTRAKVKQVFPASKINNLAAQMYARLATAGAGYTEPTWGVSLDIDLADPDLMFMSKVKILSGKAAGRELLINSVDKGVISPFSEIHPEVFRDVEVGDELFVDNKDFLAYCYNHLYSVAKTDGRGGIFEELAPWTVDGRPIYPQRQAERWTKSGPLAYTAAMSNKMIYVQPTLDNMVWPTSISSYHKRVKQNIGDRIDEHFRLWFVENACHGSPAMIGPMIAAEKASIGVWNSRLVSYDGASSQALRDLVGWVEEGATPHAYADYELSRDNQLILQPTAADRRGVQPVVSLKVNGRAGATAKVGESVAFVGVAEQPPGAGTIVAAEWDFAGDGGFRPAESVDGSSARIELQASHAFEAPGTYFVCFRVGGHCEGAQGAGVPVQNLARVRVVVSA